jgi:cation diffusion facilitator family transporter
MTIGKREKRIINASRISILGNATISVLKIAVGLIAGSLAVVADGIDSASDIITSLITLYTAYIIARPPDKKYPFGYAKADTLATKILAFIIFFAGAQLAISSVGRLIQPGDARIPDKIVITVIIVSIVVKVLLAFYLNKTGKSVSSAMLKANARNMANDVVISFSVLVGLVLTFVLKMPVLDIVTALFVSVYIMIVAFRIFLQTSREMMDGVEDQAVYEKIIKAVEKVPAASNPHRIRVRKLSHYHVIALDIEVDGSQTLAQAHKVGVEVEAQIKQHIPNIYDIVVHVEPLGNVEPDEAFGVSAEDI